MANYVRRTCFLLLTMLFTLAAPLMALAEDIIILHTNDIHCGILDNVGFPNLSQYKKDLKKAGHKVLLVDAGDCVQGAPIGKLSKGESVVRIMNAVKYDFLIPGNHEFDYGMDQFFKLAKMQKSKYHSCNFIDLRTNTLPLPSSKIIKIGGKTLGFVGVTTPQTLNTSTPKFFQDDKGNYIYGFFEDDTGEKLYAQIQKTVDQVRKDGAEYVFIVGHLGMDGSIPRWASPAIAQNTRGIDAIIDGHSHEKYAVRSEKNLDGKDVLITQTGTKLQTVGKLVLKDDGSLESTLETNLKDTDKKIEKLIAKENKKFEPILNQPVGETAFDIRSDNPADKVRRVRNGETNMGDFVADAYKNVLDTDVAIVNGGSLRNNIKKGVFTYASLLEAFPFGNMCAAVECSGQILLDALEFGASNYPEERGNFMQVSGITYTIDSRIPSSVKLDDKGNFVGVTGEYRVKDVMVNGKPLDLKANYTVGGSNYVLKNGGDGNVMFKDCKLLQDGQISDVDAIMEYVQNYLNAKIPAEYEAWDGQKRIKIIK